MKEKKDKSIMGDAAEAMIPNTVEGRDALAKEIASNIMNGSLSNGRPPNDERGREELAEQLNKATGVHVSPAKEKEGDREQRISRMNVVIDPSHPRYHEIAVAAEIGITDLERRLHYSERAREELQAEVQMIRAALDQALVSHEMIRVDHAAIVEERGSGAMAQEATRSLAEALIVNEGWAEKAKEAASTIDAQNQMLEQVVSFLGRMWSVLHPEEKDPENVTLHTGDAIRQVEEKIANFLEQGTAAAAAFDLMWIAAGGDSFEWEDAGDVVDKVKLGLASAAVKRAAGSFLDSFRRGFDRGSRYTIADRTALGSLWEALGHDQEREPWPDALAVVVNAKNALHYSQAMLERYMNPSSPAAALERLVELAAPGVAWLDVDEGEELVRRVVVRGKG